MRRGELAALRREAAALRARVRELEALLTDVRARIDALIPRPRIRITRIQRDA